MHIDAYDFENTARAVYIMNPSAREQYTSWQELLRFMESMAYMYGHQSNSFSTVGFQLTFFNGSDNEIHCRASVNAYTAIKYLETQR